MSWNLYYSSIKDKAYEKELEKCTAVHRPHH